MSDNSFVSRYLPLSIALHIVAAILLLCSFPTSSVENSVSNEKIIDAVAMDMPQVNKEMNVTKPREPITKTEDKALEAKNNELEKTVKAQQEKLAQAQQEIAQQKQAELALKKKQQQEEKQRKLAEKKKADAKKAAEKKLAEQKLAEQKATEQKIADQQRKDDEKKKLEAQKAQDAKRQAEANAAAHAKQMQSVVSQYTQLIVKAISQNWLVPANATPDMTCKLLIDLDSQGVVKNVQIIQSSSNPALDQSAVAAVYKASPLPVPNDTEALDTFRHFSLTVTPKDIQNV